MIDHVMLPEYYDSWFQVKGKGKCTHIYHFCFIRIRLLIGEKGAV